MHSLGLPAGSAGWESGRVQSRFECLGIPLTEWAELHVWQPTRSHSIMGDNLGYPMTMLTAEPGRSCHWVIVGQASGLSCSGHTKSWGEGGGSSSTQCSSHRLVL